MIRDVHHVGIAVKSMDAALALCRDALALPVVKEGGAPARGARVAVLAAGGSYLEIIQPTTDDSPFARFIEERGEGLHHLALWSDDVDGHVSSLRDKGAALEDHEPRDGFTGRLSYLRPEAFDGAIVEVVEPEDGQRGHPLGESPVTRIDHVVLRVPSAGAVIERMEEWFGMPTKRTFERGGHTFAFLRPGDVTMEVIGPTAGGEPGSGRIAGLALEVKGIDELAASLKARGYPIGEPHPALQGGRIVSVHHSGACGVPLAFIDFTGSPGPPRREGD
jgi:methylmalonyl-CoA/ethylmalonyl-CoA epimerase